MTDHRASTRLSPRLVRALGEGTAQLTILMAVDGTIVDVGPSCHHLLGYTREEMIGTNVLDYLDPREQVAAIGTIAQDIGDARVLGEFTHDMELTARYEVRAADGERRWFEIMRTNLLGDPEVQGLLVVGWRIGYERVLFDAIALLADDVVSDEPIERMISYLGLEMPDTASAVRILEGDGRWVADPSLDGLCTVSGPWDRAMETGESLLLELDDPLMPPALAAAARARGLRACWCLPVPLLNPRAYPRITHAHVADELLPPDESVHPSRLGCLVTWTKGSPHPAGGILGNLERVAIFLEVAVRRQLDREYVRSLVHYDSVTGALSRTGLRAMRHGDAPRSQIVVDLDSFKAVNDEHGHAIGDEMLRQAARRITSTIRHDDRVVRLGGDEFLILISDGSPEVAVAAAQRVVAAFSNPFSVGGLTLAASVSVGVAPYDASATFEELTERADRAMYRAKREGKNRWALWSAADDR